MLRVMSRQLLTTVLLTLHVVSGAARADDFSSLLASIGVAEHYGSFIAEDVSSAARLVALHEQDLHDLGLGVGARRLLMNWIARQAAGNAAADSPIEHAQSSAEDSKDGVSREHATEKSCGHPSLPGNPWAVGDTVQNVNEGGAVILVCFRLPSIWFCYFKSEGMQRNDNG